MARALSQQRHIVVRARREGLLLASGLTMALSAVAFTIGGMRLAEWATWVNPGQMHMLSSIQSTFVLGGIFSFVSSILIFAAGGRAGYVSSVQCQTAYQPTFPPAIVESVEGHLPVARDTVDEPSSSVAASPVPSASTRGYSEERVKLCPTCGLELPIDTVYCPKCRTKQWYFG